MKDVADRVGVSHQLVSLVMRGQSGASAATRARVKQVADEIGYRPLASARLLRQRHSNQIGVLYAMRQSFEVDLVEHLFEAAHARGYTLVLGPLTPRRPESLVMEELLGQRVEALLLLATDDGRPQTRGLDSLEMPVVQVTGPVRFSTDDDVRQDNESGMNLVVDHLVELGHRRIVYFDGGDGPNVRERRDAYVSSMERHGLADLQRVVPAAYTETAGSEAASVLLQEPELPTAIACANDRCAFGAIETLVRAGVRVPEDLSVVGYDDNSLAELPFLRLTTVRHDPKMLAGTAIDAVIQRLHDLSTDPIRRLVPAELVVRGTTSVPKS